MHKKEWAALCLAGGLLLTGCARKSNPVPLPVRDSGTPVEQTAPVKEPTPVGQENPAHAADPNYTGRPPLPLQDFKLADPENTKGLDTKKHGYSFGVAKNGQPHPTSVQNQQYFESKGFKAVCLDTKSTEKVLYLTFDCGYENGYTSKILDVLQEKQVPAAFFCTLPQVKAEPVLTARMIEEGHIVGNHSVTHPSFPSLTRLQMAQELKGMDDYLRTHFGYSAPFFRFPKGEYSDCALDAIGALGYRNIFWSVAYADWDLKHQKGEDYAVKTVLDRLHPGAIILLHSVSPDNAAALPRIIDGARAAGYTFQSLENLPM